MKKRGWVALLILAIMVSSASFLADNYFYSPFHNSWTGKINGKFLDGSITNGSAYIVSVSSNTGRETYHYNFYRFNVSTGQKLWGTSGIELSGFYNEMTQPPFSSPDYSIHNNTLYAVAFNGTGLGVINNGVVGGFEIMAINCTNGHYIDQYKLTPLQGKAAITFGFDMVVMGQTVTTSFINDSFNAGYPYQCTFCIRTYQIEPGGLVLKDSAYVSLPRMGGWQSGYENVYISGSNIAYCLNPIHKVVLYTPGGTYSSELPGTPAGLAGNSLYYGNLTSTGYSMGLVNCAEHTGKTLFTIPLHSGAQQSLKFYPELLADGHISITTVSSPVNPLNSSIGPSGFMGIRYQGFSTNGSILWNYTIPENHDGSSVSTVGSANGNSIVYTVPSKINYSPGYSSEIMEINDASGKIGFSIVYHYFINSSTGRSYSFTPPQFTGVLVYSNNYLIYGLGSGIACTHL